jgi:hypothetical protein
MGKKLRNFNIYYNVGLTHQSGIEVSFFKDFPIYCSEVRSQVIRVLSSLTEDCFNSKLMALFQVRVAAKKTILSNIVS